MAKKPFSLASNPLFAGPSMEQREQSTVPYREVSVNSIKRDPNQPRVNFDENQLSELADSIKAYGILNPILIRTTGEAGRYILVAGERRFRAANKLGLKTVPAIIDSESDETGERTLAIQLVENLQRSDLTPLERSHAIEAFKETHDLSIRQVATKLGISKSSVQRSLDILNLPADLMDALRKGAPESKVLALSKVEDEVERAEYLKNLDEFSRDSINASVSTVKSKTKKNKRKNAEDERIASEMQNAIGLKVTLERSSKNTEEGAVKLRFHSESDLQEIFRRIIAD